MTTRQTILFLALAFLAAAAIMVLLIATGAADGIQT